MNKAYARSARSIAEHIVPLAILLCLAGGAAYSQTRRMVRPGPSVIIPSSAVDGSSMFIEGNVIYVSSGDTISVAAKSGSVYLVQLEGIDAPETGQEYGKESKENLAALVEGMDVKVLLQNPSTTAPYLARVFYEDLDVSQMQLEYGMAWFYSKSLPDKPGRQGEEFRRGEQKAKDLRTGLWAAANRTPPWEFRDSTQIPKPTQTASSTAPANKRAERPIFTSSVSQPPKPLARPEKVEPRDRTYIMGPRGGCYYLGTDKRKIYVKDKTRCAKS